VKKLNEGIVRTVTLVDGCHLSKDIKFTCNIFINLHCHCLGGDLVRRYIGKYIDGKVGRWVGRWASR
jgi:hypothetical protein